MKPKIYFCKNVFKKYKNKKAASGQRGADKEGLEGDGGTEPELEWHKEEGRGGGAELSRPEGGKGAPYAGWWRPEIGLGKLE